MDERLSGLAAPGVIDAVVLDPKEKVYRLIMTETGVWTGERAQLFSLQAKLNNYVGFALERMGEEYPGSEGMDVIIRLVLTHAPDPRTKAVLERLEAAIRAEGLGFEMVVGPG
jgi:hypothetical protein